MAKDALSADIRPGQGSDRDAVTERENQSARQQLHLALRHPLRRTILREVVGEAELSPKECSERIGVHLNDVGYHFRILAKCQAIVLVRTERIRGARKHYYRFAIEEPWVLDALGLTPSSPAE